MVKYFTMEELSIEERVLKLLKTAKKSLSFEEIMKKLGLERKALKKALRNLRKSKRVLVEKGKYRWGEEVVTGKVLPYPAGFGFLQLGEGKKDVYIPPFEMAKVFGGDVVRAKVVEYKGKKEVRILRVLKRAKKQLVCKLVKRKGCLAVPIDENTHQTLHLEDECGEIKDGTLILVQIKRFPSEGSPPLGSIKKVLGHPEEKNLIIDVLVHKYSLPTEYPREVLKEIEKLEIDIQGELHRRRDLRDQMCFTIDPNKAKDFDDAVAIEKTPEGHYRLWVHIADVSHFVKEGSATDKEAFKRGFTFYLPDRTLHMLPEKLAGDLCSLRPMEDRFTLTCEMVFNSSGKLLQYDIYESIIRSKARLTYDEALRLIVGDPALEKRYPELVEPLRLMEDLYRILARMRWDRGSIDFDLPEAELIVDEYGEPVAVLPYERHTAHRIIEQFMISANETVAMHLENMGYPCLFRVHEKPDPERIESLLEILAGLGYKVRKGPLTPKFFQKIIEDFEGRSEENLVRFLTLRSMKRAHYSPNNLGHFGLASESYAHFTSPIRRYPDLIVHRLLKKALGGEEIEYESTLSYLEMAGMHLSQQERLAEDVEREAIDRLKVRFMRSHLGEEFEGVVTGVVSFGLFVEIQEYLVEGLVNLSTLKDDHYVYDEPAHRLVGVRTGKVYRLGDRVKVKVVGLDEDRARLELLLL